MARRDRALAELRNLLAGGTHRDGSRLPPERILCGDLGVSRSALREALDVLEAEGVIWRQVGNGTYVGRRPIKTSADLVAISTMTSPADVMEARLLIEPSIARLATLRATDAEISEMRRYAQKYAMARDAKALELWDGKLHRAVAQSVRNALLQALFDGFNMVRGQAAWGQLGAAALTKERGTTYAQQHQLIVQAIADRDGDAAEGSMRAHLKTVRTNLLRTADDLNSGVPADSMIA